MDWLALFLTFLARNFGAPREEKIKVCWGEGLKKSYVLGPLTVVSDTIILSKGCLWHFINDKHVIRVRPGWVKGYDDDGSQGI